MDIGTKKSLKTVALWLYYVMLPIVICPILFKDALFGVIAEYPSLIFIIIGAVLNAVMDCISAPDHIVSTKFANLNPNFWSKMISADKAKKIFGWKFDAWHLAKSGMIILLCFAIALQKEMFGFWWDVLFYGVLWNFVFNGFFNHAFKK
jgi:hypothetical protein